MSAGSFTTNSVLRALQAHKAELQQRGFAHVSLFGSAARGQATAGSDIDLLVELDRTKQIGFEYFATLARLEQILGRKVDVVTAPVRKPALAARIAQDRVNAF